MTNSNADTQIQLTETKQAYEAFAEVCKVLGPIASGANDYPQRITGLALQGAAGPAFASCVSEWTTGFYHLWSVLGQVTAQVEITYLHMLRINGLNSDLAAGLPSSASAS